VPTLDDYRWLVSDQAAPWLGRAAEELASVGGLVTSAITTRLRKDLSAERAHLVLEQIELRQRAREKFSRAERMFFTRKGLEQATDEAIAVYKSVRFPARDNKIYDICCGIGGDLIGLAPGRAARGIDNDEVCEVLAEANLIAHGVRNAFVLTCSADNWIRALDAAELSHLLIWHIDPDRRPVGKRTTNLEAFEPPLPVIKQLLTRSPHGAVKLAPASDVPAEWEPAAEREWIESRGECRQQVVWHGDLALHPGRRSATVVDSRAGVRTVVGIPQDSLPLAPALGRYLYEPCAAVLAARLAGQLAAEHGLAAVSPGIAYLTGDNVVTDGALAGFEVLDILPLDRKQLRAYCRERGLARLEIKKRSVDVDPEKLRREIAADGEGEATILLAPLGSSAKAIVARRIQS
jgi:hypothetical protein